MTRGGMSVALIGPDGVGKSTISRLIVASSEDMRYLYMGVNLAASSVMLPTTRILLAAKQRGGRSPDLIGWPSSGGNRGRKPSWRAWIRIGNLILEEWFRAGIAWFHQLRGRVVVMDRHFLADYWKHDMDTSSEDRPLVSRIHGVMLRRLYPRPDLVILLNLDPHESYRRKPEGALEDRIARHAEYRQLGELFGRLVVVDANSTVDEVLNECLEAIGRFREHESR